jgi:hypothetical protein
VDDTGALLLSLPRQQPTTNLLFPSLRQHF